MERPELPAADLEAPPVGSWAKTYTLVLALHVLWLALLLWMTLRWSHEAPP